MDRTILLVIIDRYGNQLPVMEFLPTENDYKEATYLPGKRICISNILCSNDVMITDLFLGEGPKGNPFTLILAQEIDRIFH